MLHIPPTPTDGSTSALVYKCVCKSVWVGDGSMLHVRIHPTPTGVSPFSRALVVAIVVRVRTLAECETDRVPGGEVAAHEMQCVWVASLRM